MDKLQWIKELVVAEQDMEESGVVDLSDGFDADKHLHTETIEFLHDLKASFIEVASAFNQLKGSTLGKIKIYGISNTPADFMLFRNGLKLIFSMNAPGEIDIHFSNLSSSYIPGSQERETNSSSDTLSADWGAFAQLKWTFKGHEINMDYLIRYYMSRFVKDSTR